jgi:hypothetical protein
MLHHDDPARSLPALTTVGPIRNDLQQIADADLDASLGNIPETCSPEGHSFATREPSVGTPTSTGLRFRVLRPLDAGRLGVVSMRCLHVNPAPRSAPGFEAGGGIVRSAGERDRLCRRRDRAF